MYFFAIQEGIFFLYPFTSQSTVVLSKVYNQQKRQKFFFFLFGFFFPFYLDGAFSPEVAVHSQLVSANEEFAP